MKASQQLDEARSLARNGEYREAYKALSAIDPDSISEEERKRLDAGLNHVRDCMNATSSLHQIVAALKEASSDRALWGNKPQSDGPAPYLSWQTVVQLLDRHAPGWQSSVTRIIESPEAFIVTVQIEIAGAKRQASYRSERFGTRRDGTSFAYTAPMETAERRAMARAATLFGCGATPPERRNSNRRRR